MSRPLREAMSIASGQLLDQTFGEATSEQCYAAEIRALAEIIEQRGAQGLDHNPGETADWLRAEAERAEGRA
jgi:hypothetical protein